MNENCLPYIMYLEIIFVSIDFKILSGHEVILNFFSLYHTQKISTNSQNYFFLHIK